MSSARSIIGELYGVETARRPARQGGLGLAIVMLLGGIFLYESIHPVMRLRSEPPSFRETAATKDHQVPVAGSYWNRAASFMSENYAYGELLPTKPPKDFTTAMGGDYITSSIYWQKVRSSWNQPENWVQSYRFDTEWIFGAMDSACKLAESYFSGQP